MDKITVVTICYNAENEIEDTMRSVLQQNYNNIEYIIIDGASTDNTLEIINDIREENEISDIIVVSEKDNGIYDAMNKGISLATGNWILFMNAGDSFFDSTVVSEVFSYKFADEVKGVYGDTVRFTHDYEKVVPAKSLECIKTDIPLPFCHQSVFVRTEIMRSFRFDTQYKQAADYAFFMKCFLEGYKFEHVDIIVSKYSLGGISEINTVFHLREKILIRESMGVEKYNLLKKTYMLFKLEFKQIVKRVMPQKLLKFIRGY